MPATIPALLLLAVLASPGPPADLQTIPPTVKPGVKVIVVDDRGSKSEGRVHDVSDAAVHLAIDGRMVDIPIDRIIRIERPDTVKNGALTGMTVGMGMGLLSTMADPQDGAILVARTLGNGVIFAGLGALIDAAIDGRKTLYERGRRPTARVRPIVGGGIRGIAASIEW